jgi:phosphate transport system permease protein/phosphate transport system substrate-binding protein
MLLASIVPLVMSAKAFAQSVININGAGASFPFPLIDTWRVEYKELKPNVNLNYQSIGSGGGIRQFTERTVDFGATDAPLTAAQTSALPSKAVHIPETIGSVVAAYNVIGIPNKGLKLTGPVIADIFLAKITKWDDPAIKALNPSLPLPSKDIIVVHRSDGSGTTFVWTDYLSKVSTEWRDTVGKGTAVSWPTGIGAPGNEGVANAIRGTAYTIGYIELAYALTNNMQYAFIQNQEGNFIEPSLESTSAAVGAAAATLPKGDESWESVSLTNAPGPDSYPIASFSYLLLYIEMSTTPQTNSMEKAKEIVDFIAWAISEEGQAFAEELDYVPLPDEVVQLNMETLASLTFNGEPVLATEEEPSVEEPPVEESPTEEPPTEEPPAEEEPFTVSSSLDGKSYTVTGKSTTATATGFTINPHESVMVEFDGSGEVELTLPKSMIDGITTVNGERPTVVSETASTTTIRFTVPEGSDSVEIQGAMVVPEFPVVVAMILAATIGGIVAYTRFIKNGAIRQLT